MDKDAVQILEQAGVKPTPNRVLVLRGILSAKSPMSLIELETALSTLERSSILRVLSLLHEHGVVHTIEDGRGITKYEICHGDHRCGVDDMHPHFYCEKCHKVYCFDNLTIPHIDIPEGFLPSGINFMIKGICPSCLKGEKA